MIVAFLAMIMQTPQTELEPAHMIHSSAKE